ncbi:carbohydrate ABC transporter permease [Porcincola intestinalis]|uniref:carbohydrate ABC transporter permease n=1 Tax=Porcincola intestinalis TaxID=2606632 RepID=UPI0023F4A53A|nr:sugar ABC transporter permease [Porcincola intestinalis]MCI6768023.1 sugar ABC transporter permease [Lachnospiraceae bacterium]MDD7060257.1 sugar ABC transporter permease [Porcincola intestinalis]MDY4204674.1 sugar ABC transporter permease [Porcincola intestinalis]MDY5284325.1 sugar ABC transporter permease [Porcincola intestinalis]
MTSKKRRSNGRRTREAYGFILPGVLYMLVVVGYPIVYNFILSFKDTSVRNLATGTSKFIGFQNYIELFHNPTFILVLKNTFVFTIGSLIFQFTIGYLLALFFYKKFALSGPIRGLMLIPYMMPMAVTGLLGQNLFLNSGLINNLLSKVGIAGPAWLTSTSTAMIAVVIMNCWVGIPFNMLLLISGMSNISEDVYEASAIDGASRMQQFWKITMPLMKDSILAVLMLGFIYTFRAFDLMFIMTAGGPLNSTDVLGTYSYMLSFTQYQFSKGSAVAIVLFLCLLLIGILYLLLLRKDDKEEEA